MSVPVRAPQRRGGPGVAAARAGVPAVRPDRQPAARPRLRVVGPPARRHIQPRGWMVLGGVALFVILFALAAFHTVLVSSQERLDALERQVSVQQHRYQDLRLEVARLESPERIRNAALYQLGMVPAGTPTYVTPSGEMAAEVEARAQTTEPETNEPGPADQNDVAAEATTAHPDTSWPAVKPYLEPTP